MTLVSTSHEVVSWKTIVKLEKLSDVYITDEIPAHTAYGDFVLRSRGGDSYFVAGRSYASK